MSNKGNPMLGARIPLEWMTQYQELAAERGCKVAELAREALGQYLKMEGDSSDSTDITLIPDLKARLEAIEAFIGDSGDSTDITLIPDLKARLEAIEAYIGDSSDITNIALIPDLKARLETIEAFTGDSSDSTDITLIPDLKTRLEAIEVSIGDSGDIKVISQKLKLLENQLQELQNQVTDLTRKEQPVKTENKPVTEKEGWLTTGEAYSEAKRRGLTSSAGTFRRWLREASETEQLPIALQSLDLQADWASRKQGNPKDNSLRWLRFI